MLAAECNIIMNNNHMRQVNYPITACKALISKRLSVHYPTIEYTSRVLGIPVRTLQRRFRESGLSYSQLVDQVRLELACSLVERGISAGRYCGDPGLCQSERFQPRIQALVWYVTTRLSTTRVNCISLRALFWRCTSLSSSQRAIRVGKAGIQEGVSSADSGCCACLIPGHGAGSHFSTGSDMNAEFAWHKMVRIDCR